MRRCSSPWPSTRRASCSSATRRSRAELLLQRARDAARRDPQTEVQLRADTSVPYGRVAELIGLVQQAGLSRIGFVTEAPAREPPAQVAPPTIAG